MKILNILRSAFRALRRNKMRSFLTMLGIIIGVAAVIAMLAIGQGAEYSVEQQISSLGTNVLIVLPGSQQTGGLRVGAGTMTNLTDDDAQAIQRECPAVALVSPGTRGGGQVIAGNMNWATGVEGTGPDYLEIRNGLLSTAIFIPNRISRRQPKCACSGRLSRTISFRSRVR